MAAEDRREQVIKEAVTVFASAGYEGATTAAIAARVGVSQPYLFRLFPSKKDLFLAASERNMVDTRALFRQAAGGKTGHDALEQMAAAYQEKLGADRGWLLMQLQSFAACHDDDIREQTRHCLMELWSEVESLTGLPIEDRVLFFAKGMLCNVIAAADPPGEPEDRWASITQALQKHSGRTPDGQSTATSVEAGTPTT